ncbi:MAG: hypothetical protein KGQ52_14430 [Alphaproteobacteria bacterium]|nr:hypothetical protein [Alphaproteobacteria bacterium]
MLARAILIAAGAALLASCGEPVVCDHKGFIVIPKDASMEDDLKWRGENRDLLNRRMAAVSNEDGQAQFYSKQALTKAASCP